MNIWRAGHKGEEPSSTGCEPAASSLSSPASRPLGPLHRPPGWAPCLPHPSLPLLGLLQANASTPFSGPSCGILTPTAVYTYWELLLAQHSAFLSLPLHTASTLLHFEAEKHSDVERWATHQPRQTSPRACLSSQLLTSPPSPPRPPQTVDTPHAGWRGKSLGDISPGIPEEQQFKGLSSAAGVPGTPASWFVAETDNGALSVCPHTSSRSPCPSSPPLRPLLCRCLNKLGPGLGYSLVDTGRPRLTVSKSRFSLEFSPFLFFLLSCLC